MTDLFPETESRWTASAEIPSSEFASSPDHSLDYCSGCGVCSLVCPHGVQIAEMNSIARAEIIRRDGLPLRNWLVGRSELLGRVGSTFAPLVQHPT